MSDDEPGEVVEPDSGEVLGFFDPETKRIVAVDNEEEGEVE